jgi:DNA-binding MarR family transcriptional regulator
VGEQTSNELTNDAGFLLSKVTRRLKMKWSQKVAELNLSTVEAALIRNLASMPKMTARARARYLATDPMAVHRSLESLVEKGLCEKRETSNRRYDVTLTEEGERIADKVFAMSHEVWNEIESVIGRDRVESLKANLLAVDQFLENSNHLEHSVN